jgi:hypothetical protein
VKVDISILENESIKLKGKQATFIVDPIKNMPKTASDGIIFLNGSKDKDTSRVTDYRTIIDGPGEYEVSGAKISGTKTPSGIIYKLSIDNISIVLGYAADAKMEGFSVGQVALINTGNNFNESFITALEPKLTILYGEKRIESAKTLGKDIASSVSKITIAKDKMPLEMEVVALG